MRDHLFREVEKLVKRHNGESLRPTPTAFVANTTLRILDRNNDKSFIIVTAALEERLEVGWKEVKQGQGSVASVKQHIL